MGRLRATGQRPTTPGCERPRKRFSDRLARPAGAKFRRVNPLTRGYHPADVDAFAARISQYFESGRALPIETVRTIAFRSRYRGYNETQVDLLLDTVAGLMLAVR